MAILQSLFGKTPDDAPLVGHESDQVYPVFMFDDTSTFRGIIVTWTMVFNDALDADKLHIALSKLLEIGDWRKLGGRLRKKIGGGLEIYVPTPFTVERPAVTYTNQKFDIMIENHPEGKLFPKPTKLPSIHPGPTAFRKFATRDGAPRTIEEYLSGDIPQISLHITSFTDATVVGLSFPHTMTDVSGQEALLRSWSLVLAGRESEVSPLLGAREDAMVAAANDPNSPREESILSTKCMQCFAMLNFGIRFAWDFLWYRVVENRTVCLPQEFLTNMYKRARGEIEEVDEKGERPFISEGDVLVAWGIRAIASTMPKARPVTVMQALNPRFRLPSLINVAGVYVQNMAVTALTFLPYKLATGSLGPIALENRQCVAQHATEGQILSSVRAAQHFQSNERMDHGSLLFGPSEALLVLFSNWTRADLFKAGDFSPAIMRQGGKAESRVNPPGTIVFQYGSSMRQAPTARNFFMVVGKDYGGNCWLSGILLPPAWAKIEQELKDL